jgi:AcrR family transcriptional regulator
MVTTANLSDERRDRFLGAAIACFAQYGFRRTSMGSIAEAADVSRPALYQYFTSKDDIFRAAVAWELSKLASYVEGQADRMGAADERLVATLKPVLRMHRTAGDRPNRTASPFYGEMLDETYARAGDLWDEFETRVLVALRSVLERHTAEQAFGPDVTAHEVAEVLFYGTKGIAVHVSDAPHAARLLKQLVALTIRGITPPG